MNFISLMLAALFIAIIYKITLVLYHYYINRQRYKNLPRIHGVPLAGVSIELISMTEPERARWYESCGCRFREGLFLTWIGLKPFVSVHKPEYLEVILSSTVNIEKGTPYEMIAPWLGNGLLTSTGSQWFHDRRLIGPTFYFNVLEKFIVVFSEKAEILIKCLEKEIEKNQGGPIDFFPFAINVTLDIICETAMGVNVCAQETTNEYCTNVKRMSGLTMERLFRPWYWLDWIYYSMPMGKEYRTLLDKLHGFTKKVINKKKIARQTHVNGNNEVTHENKNEFDTGKQKRKAFLDLLLDQNEIENAAMTDDQLRAQVDTFMFEGHDTTACAITWTLLLLGSNLEHQEKLHEELEEVFQDSQAPATLKELSQLKYLDRVIKETLRLFPSVPLITRKLAEDVKLGDYNISKGTTVILAIFLTHRNFENWPDPLKFDPDRFLPENSKGRHPYAYVPFSAGPRNCIGQKFALLEEKTVLTAILRKWRVKSLKSHNTVKMCSSMIARPAEEIFIHFAPKK